MRWSRIAILVEYMYNQFVSKIQIQVSNHAVKSTARLKPNCYPDGCQASHKPVIHHDTSKHRRRELTHVSQSKINYGYEYETVQYVRQTSLSLQILFVTMENWSWIRLALLKPALWKLNTIVISLQVPSSTINNSASCPQRRPRMTSSNTKTKPQNLILYNVKMRPSSAGPNEAGIPTKKGRIKRPQHQIHSQSSFRFLSNVSTRSGVIKVKDSKTHFCQWNFKAALGWQKRSWNPAH